MLHYILQTIAFQLFFLIIYDVFLKKETFFNWNRAYLLLTSIVSIVIPFIKIESIKAVVPQQFVIRLPEVIIGDITPTVAQPTVIGSAELLSQPLYQWNWEFLLYIGMAIATIILITKIVKISLLIQKHPNRSKRNMHVVTLPKSKAAFSFFNYVFLGELIQEEEKQAILEHEWIHVQQKHTLDLMLFEVLRIVFWFNPLMYMYQNRMTTLHEYIADASAIKQNNKTDYYQNLLSQVFDTKQISFINTFYKQSLIKKRIVMLSKSRSNRIYLLKYALLIPLVFGMLMYTSTYSQEKMIHHNTSSQELTFEQLVDKYYNEILGLAKENVSLIEIQQKYDMRNNSEAKNKYIKSKDDVARMKAYNKYSADLFIKSEKEQGALTEETLKKVANVLNQYKTYQDYLAYQKTDQAISDWESDIHDGVLRLAVNDIKNLTQSEEERKKQKLALIEKDDYFYKLFISDGYSNTEIQIGEKTPKIESDDFGSVGIEVPFSVIDEVPTFKKCEMLATNEEKKECTSNTISSYVNKNFNIKLADDLKLKGKQRIIVVFKIDKDGTIKDVEARAPHPALEAEAIRVIKSLPQMIPGKQKGKTVVVPYSLPIIFQIRE